MSESTSDPLSLIDDMWASYEADSRKERSEPKSFRAERTYREYDSRIKTESLPLDRFNGKLPDQ
jgi:hypothetical protein